MSGIHSATHPRYPDGMSAADPVTSESRRFAVRLPRPLWIAVAAGALIVAALGLRFGVPIYRKLMVVRNIERLGGLVQRTPGGPKWLQHWAGYPWTRPLDNVPEVSLQQSGATDIDLVHFNELTSLQSLDLTRTQVGDAGLAHLNGLANLKELKLMSTQVTDRGLAHLGAMDSLEVLDLRFTQISDEGLPHISRMMALRYLDLRYTRVTNAGLVHIHRLTNLKDLALDKGQVTDAQISELNRVLPRLTVHRME